MNSINSQNKIFEKQVKINGLNINYRTIGNGDIPVVFLHGWVKDCEKYLPLDKYFLEEQKYYIFIPDMPGFGKSEEPKESWDLDNYVELVHEFIKNVRQKDGCTLVNETIIIGHSFGGRIAIKYAVKYPEKVSKLILTGAAGVKHNLTIKQKILFILAKMGKVLFSIPGISYLQKPAQKILYKMARVKDYHQASPIMKEAMKNVLDEDLTPYLEKIGSATLLVWGRLDKTTPLSDGKIMDRKIRNSKLVIIDDANHSLPYQRPKEFIKIIFEFLNH
ncbi:MAG: alpha/beta hydrolase [Candidatus Pacebacteria bacterium]|nr:alpha/beta hydrolase [Candidatus Paceibacterota bacterium]